MMLRQSVFIVEQNCPYLDADIKDPLSFHLFLRDSEGKIVAYSRLVPEGVSYPGYSSIGRVVVHEKIRKTGEGKQLMKASIQACIRCFGNLPIKISAQQYLHQFYSSLGFVQVSEPYLEDDIPHIAMIMKNPENQLTYLKDQPETRSF
jgi:ElaA protein